MHKISFCLNNQLSNKILLLRNTTNWFLLSAKISFFAYFRLKSKSLNRLHVFVDLSFFAIFLINATAYTNTCPAKSVKM